MINLRELGNIIKKRAFRNTLSKSVGFLESGNLEQKLRNKP